MSVFARLAAQQKAPDVAPEVTAVAGQGEDDQETEVVDYLRELEAEATQAALLRRNEDAELSGTAEGGPVPAVAIRRIVLDTETTGFEPREGHRVVELGMVETINFKKTGRKLQIYFNPERDVPIESFRVHGLSRKFLKDMPRFRDRAQDILDFIGEDAVLVAHNAQFDRKFLNYEFALAGLPPLPEFHDTLAEARDKFHFRKNDLDTLCQKFGVDAAHRTVHGALLDADILADLQAAMQGPKTLLSDLEIEEAARRELAGDDDDENDGIEAVTFTEAELAELRAKATDADAGFVHLRCHSAYSLSRGAMPVKQLIKAAKEAGMPAVALTDTDNMFGALEFAVTAKDVGLRPITGVELTLRDVTNPQDPIEGQIVLLAETMEGYANLMKLVSRAHVLNSARTENKGRPVIGFEDLAEFADGLICLSGGSTGLIDRLLTQENDVVMAMMQRLASLFPERGTGPRFYIEIQRGLDVTGEHRKVLRNSTRESNLRAAARRCNLPLVATANTHFATTNMREAAEALLAQGHIEAKLTDANAFLPSAEMQELFADIPESCQQTIAIANRCAGHAVKQKPLLPHVAEDEAEELGRRTREGLEARLDVAGIPEAERGKYRERVEFELGVIGNMGFSGYFLIVADFINWSKDHDIPVGPGRGSGAGSAVAWAMRITDLDPLEYGLLFERFLNPDRVSMPDFDIDFCQDRREETINYVQAKYGADRVAQIITFQALKAKAAVRNAGRALGVHLRDVDRFAKRIPSNPSNPLTLKQVLEADEELRADVAKDEAISRLFRISQQIEGLYKSASTHAAGVVIGDRPLDQLVPLYRDPRSTMPATQFNMKWVESAGLVKFDFLGLKTLSIIHMAARLAGIDQVPHAVDDALTYKLLTSGDTQGVFQLESGGMRDVLKKMRPDRISDLVAVVALYRPGPMDQIPRFIACKHAEAANKPANQRSDLETIDYMHPLLEPILKETYGVIVYQEQVMQIAQALAGYSLGQADLLRRAMGKKVQAEMDAQRAVFIEGAQKNGVSEEKAVEIFNKVDKFASYGFNKSHAAAYAVVSYQTAWLKTHHPLAFFVANLNYERGNTDKTASFIQDARAHGIPTMAPDINASDALHSIEPDIEEKIRFGLSAIKGMGEAAAAFIEKERKAHGPFASLEDFIDRIDLKVVNKKSIESMCMAGCFDRLCPDRGQAFHQLETLLIDKSEMEKAIKKREKKTDARQTGLFDGAIGGGLTDTKPKKTAKQAARAKIPMPLRESVSQRLKKELAAFGFYITGHPLDAADQAFIDKDDKVRTRRTLLENQPRFAHLAGCVTSVVSKVSKSSGNTYLLITLVDRESTYEVLCFRDIEKVAAQLAEDTCVILDVNCKYEVVESEDGEEENEPRISFFLGSVTKIPLKVEPNVDLNVAPF